MSVRLPLADAPRPDDPLKVEGARIAPAEATIAIVPVSGLEASLCFAEHLLRALRVGGRPADAWVVERARSGESSRAGTPPEAVGSRLHQAGAEQVLWLDVSAGDAGFLRERLVGHRARPLVAIGADVPCVLEPTLTLSITGGKPPTAWGASARASRPWWDAEVVEVRSELARGIASALSSRFPERRAGT